MKRERKSTKFLQGLWAREETVDILYSGQLSASFPGQELHIFLVYIFVAPCNPSRHLLSFYRNKSRTVKCTGVFKGISPISFIYKLVPCAFI